MRFSRSYGRGIIGMAIFTGMMSVTGAASAMDTFMIGPRATGMAGANVASVNDTSAQYYNPAAFGFFGCQSEEGERLEVDGCDIGRKKWGVDIHAGAGYRQHNEFGEYIDDLADIDHDLLSQTGIQSESDLRDLIKLANDLQGLDKPGNAVSADANAGLGIRVLHFGIGVRGYAQATGRVLDIDTANLGISVSGADIAADIGTLTMPTGYVSGSYTMQVFTSTQVSQLRSAMGDPGGTDPNTLEAVQRLDYMAYQESISAADVEGTVNLLDSVLNQSGATTLDDNTSTVRLNGFGVLEVPLTYGYAINDWIAVGANIKFMKGRVYGNQIIVFDNDSGDTIDKTDEFYEETNTIGIDIGVMARMNKFQFGLVGRNLNSPEFDGPTVTINGTPIKFGDVTIDPQCTAGVAFFPFQTLTLEADIDLTQNRTTLENYDTQNMAFGLEWDAFRFLALRAGAYKNLAESDIDWVYTAGLGLNLWAARLDVAGAVAEEKQQFDNEDIPKECRVSAQLSVDF